MQQVDLNCDMGEDAGESGAQSDEALMKQVTSINVACGFHAGDSATIHRTVAAAIKHELAIGAHPGFPDREGFGRRDMLFAPEEVYAMMVYQIGAVQAFAAAQGGRLSHVKPHGALYNRAAKDAAWAEAVAEAVYRVDGSLILYGLSGSEMVRAGERIGLRTANEVFADRMYEEDGSLTPRSIEGAVLTDSAAAAEQAVRMVLNGEVVTRGGKLLKLRTDTICIHGDTPGAEAHSIALRQALREAGIHVSRADQIALN
ncbi:5-oxoprolinase subunit PxpA [Paenibacillus sp. HB172176]|uniref:LamB/YcsF family protein n=1 Tax=Paenibacillus sp. HB172176 TaxID=2493690 RepID=UPI00143C8978|nr:5-oxoprolinase subunit PxpA [Paenibacillus sp. HB172176]